MFIQTESTPNPHSLKFIPGQILHEEEPIAFTNKEECARSPLAQLLFLIPSVKGVFLGRDFITISKDSAIDWSLMKPEILTSLMEYFMTKKPVLLDASAIENSAIIEESDPIIREIKELIETKIRPSVAQDGGDIVFHSFENGIVKLEMRGACSGCPSSTVTLKNGIESMLKHYVPEVISVEAVDPVF